MPHSPEPECDEVAAGPFDMARLAELLWPLANVKRLDILAFLTQPHYLEEVAAHLQVSRQAARKHLDALFAIGVIQRRPAVRGKGAVVEYCVNPRALFLIWQEFEKLGALRPEGADDRVAYTRIGAEPSDDGPVDAPPGPPAGPALWVVHGLNTGVQFPLPAHRQQTWLLGRDGRSDVCVDYDPYVSTRHAEVHAQDGHFVLTDLASRNGTRHNGVMLPRGGDVVLRHGDLIAIGRTMFLFWQRRPDLPTSGPVGPAAITTGPAPAPRNG